MHRVAALLASLLIVSPQPADAGDGPSLLDRETLEALRVELRTSGATLDDVAAPARDRSPADLPLRNPNADSALAAPLRAPDIASGLATRIAQDVGSRGPAGWDGFFGLLAEQWDAKGDAADSCAGQASGEGLAAQHIAAAEANGERWSRREINDLQSRLNPELNRILGQLSDQASIAACRVEQALPELTPEAREALLVDGGALLTLPDRPTEAQGAVAARAVEAWSQVHKPTLIRAAKDWSEAVDAAALGLAGLDPSAWPSSPVIWRVGLGEVWIGSPAANSGTGNPVLLVDPGGDDHWRIRADGTSLAEAPVRGWIDLGGDDVWRSGPGGAGVGVLGVGAGVDLAGDDVHTAADFATGAGYFGVATWLDAGGDDVYEGERAVQGCGLLGAGRLRDTGRGDDVHEASSLSQGAGLPGGIGVLHDDGGVDRYLVTPAPDSGLCGGGCSQGAGIGVRPFLAGGLGLLVDDSGEDLYTSGGSSQGSGLWHGLGVLRDGGGDDGYLAETWSAGSADRQAVGVLIDSTGNDRYLSRHHSVACAGVRSVAWLVDLAGYDEYSSSLGVGWSKAADSASFLVDVGGAARWGGGRPGAVAGHPRAVRRAPAIAAVVGRRVPGELAMLGGMASSPTATVAELQGALKTASLPMSDGLDDVGDGIGALIRRRTPPGQLADLARAIRTDATGRERSEDDYSVAWHLTWLGWIAKAAPLAASDLEATAAALADHPSRVVRTAVWDARAALGEIPDLEFPPEEAERLATAAAVVLQKEENAEVRAAAARATRAFGTSGVASSLADALLGAHLGLRRSAEASLVAVCDRTDGVAVARALYAAASGKERIDPVARDAALRVLGATGQRDAVALLVEALTDHDPSTALAAAIGLVRDGGREATRALDEWRESAPEAAQNALEAVVPIDSD